MAHLTGEATTAGSLSKSGNNRPEIADNRDSVSYSYTRYMCLTTTVDGQGSNAWQNRKR